MYVCYVMLYSCVVKGLYLGGYLPYTALSYLIRHYILQYQQQSYDICSMNDCLVMYDDSTVSMQFCIVIRTHIRYAIMAGNGFGVCCITGQITYLSDTMSKGEGLEVNTASYLGSGNLYVYRSGDRQTDDFCMPYLVFFLVLDHSLVSKTLQFFWYLFFVFLYLFFCILLRIIRIWYVNDRFIVDSLLRIQRYRSSLICISLFCCCMKQLVVSLFSA